MRFLTVAILSVLTAGCAASTTPLHPSRVASSSVLVGATTPAATIDADGAPAEGDIVAQQRGSCSWYGGRFHGRKTSNGETFDKHALTAAHRSLPFGSEVEVTDVTSGRKVRVRINDRGPFSHQRILDLSYAAASSLDIVGRGVADVELRLVDIGSSKWPEEIFAVEVARFDSKIDAEQFVEGLSKSQRAAGLYYVKAPDAEARAYRVRFGPFTCEESAKTAADQLRRVGLKPSMHRETLNGDDTVADAHADPARLVR
jgi:rare lipoprotein A